MAIGSIPFTYHGLSTRPNRELLFIKDNGTNTIQAKVNILRSNGTREELAPLPNDKVTVRFECTASKVDALTQSRALFFDRPLASLSHILQNHLLSNTKKSVKILLSTVAGEEKNETIEGVVVNVATRDRRTHHLLVIAAARGGDIDIIKTLMGRGDVDLEVNYDIYDGKRALRFAIENDQLGIVRFLLEQDVIDLKARIKDFFDTPLILAVNKSNRRMVEILLKSEKLDVSRERDFYDLSPLHHSVFCGDKEILQFLLESNKFDINGKDHWGFTLLHYAAKFLEEQDARGIIKLLFTQPGIDVGAKTNGGRTALHLAAAAGNEAVIGILLGTNQLSIQDRDKNNLTPIDCASFPEIKKLLLEKSAESEITKAFEEMSFNETAKVCSGIHEERLYLGAKNFSEVWALVKKHDEKANHPLEESLASSITATELDSNLPPDAYDNIEELKKRGATILLGVDATRIYERFEGRTFSRIHWNCPHDGKSFTEQTLPKILRAFLESCRHVQNNKDRVHVSLVQPKNDPSKKDFYQGYYYNIVPAVAHAGYRLFRKRVFGRERYPGYRHAKTRGSGSAPVTEQGMREFIFEKVSNQKFLKAKEIAEDDVETLANLLKKGSAKAYSLKKGQFYDQQRLVIDCSTDEDSSAYEAK